MPAVDFAPGAEAPPEQRLSLLVHMMSAGRLQLFDKRAIAAGPRSRVLIRLTDGRELRLREFGTKQRAWAQAAAERRDRRRGDGRDARPRGLAGARPSSDFAPPLDQPRQLHPLLRDQRTIAGIGRSWVDEILWEAKLSPFKKGSELDDDEIERLHEALAVLGEAIDHYEEVVGPEVPDKMPMPLQVHRREGEPCPRCGDDDRRDPLLRAHQLLLPDRAERRQALRRPPAFEAAQVGPRTSPRFSSGLAAQ